MGGMRTRQGISLALACIVALASVLGCNTDPTPRIQPPPAVDDYQLDTPRQQAPANYDYDVQARQAPEQQQRSGMSGRTKTMVVLAGAAALYYLYKKHQAAKATHGADSQYYLSKNGRVYYRDEQGRAHWVTPPPGGIQVPADEASAFRDLQGYDNRATGRDLRDVYEQGVY